jgi:hypothetical protein
MLQQENGGTTERASSARLKVRVYAEDLTDEQLALLQTQAMHELRRRGITEEDIARICNDARP